MALFLGEHAVDLFAGQPVRSDTILDSLTVTPSSSAQTFTPSTDIDGWDEVTVNPIPSEYIVPSGTINITSNGTTNVSQYANANVQVPKNVELQAKTATPTESNQTVTADSGYDGLSSVAVEAIDSEYVGSNIAKRSSSDLTVNGASITAPAGYYSAAASKSVASGSAAGPSSLSGSSASVSTGTNTLTLTKTNVTTTPTVSPGYVSSGTASTATVSLTANVTTKAAATITPGTSNQTISSGTYLTGTQTIVGDADLVGGNILSTANIFGVQGEVVVQKYYTGSSAPSSSLGNNGDIYIQA